MITTLTPRFFCEKPRAAQPAPGFILYERAQSYEWEGAGQLSLKIFRGGQAFYRVGQARYRLENPAAYLLLNHQQPYSISLEAEAEAESFCLFFEPGLAEEVYHSLSARPHELLGNPNRLSGSALTPTLNFFERTYPANPHLAGQIERLRLALERGSVEQGWLHEQFSLIMHGLVQTHFGLTAELDLLTAVRPATREELYRRLHQARDYIEACYNQPLTLDDLAAVACLSPNHLLRTFRQLFGQTPHQYLTERRLERACRLLTASSLSVTEISLAVGFESLGSFSWLFRRRFNLSPQLFRRQNG